MRRRAPSPPRHCPAPPEPRRMAWNRSRDEIRQKARFTTTFEEVVLLAIFIVGLGFETWFFFFAKCSSALC